MGQIKTFRELDIWRKGIELVKVVYKATSRFPNHELYTLVSQMRRSAISVPSNAAEGFRRRHAKEFAQFLNIATGSLAELETQIVIAAELGYINQEINNELLELTDHINRMIANLRKRL